MQPGVWFQWTTIAPLLSPQVEDLSHQLRIIMKEQLRLSRGTVVDGHGAVSMASPARTAASVVPPSRFDDDLEAVNSLDPDDVISENLVTFRDITELQTRNVQLLRVVRQLSASRSEDMSARQAEVEAAASAGLQVRAPPRDACWPACWAECLSSLIGG